MVVDLTTEVRWFFDGRLPPDVLSWFTDGIVGLLEERCDRYRLDEQVDIGVKRRAQTKLELKLRLRPPELFILGRYVEGSLETWQRWSPADGRIYLTDNTIWVDIAKRVIKRRFDVDGREVPLSEANRAMTGDGCDIEVATVEVNGQSAWTFAFAAFGHVDNHRQLLETAWDAVVSGRPRPDRLRLDYVNSCGYPEWMTRFYSHPHPALSHSYPGDLS